MRNESGFIMVEAAVAILICALAIVTALKISTDSARNQAIATQTIVATLEARNLMARIGEDIALKPGDFENPLPGGRRAAVSIEPYDPGRTLTPLFHVSIQVLDQRKKDLVFLEEIKTNAR